MHNTMPHSGLVTGFLAAGVVVAITLGPGVILGIAQRAAARMPAEKRDSYREEFRAAGWVLAVAWFNCLLGAGMVCMGIPYPKDAVFFATAGGVFLATGAVSGVMLRRAGLMITESEIRYRIALENWSVARAEIRNTKMAYHLLPAVGLEMEAGRQRFILLVFRDTARILHLLGAR